VLAATDNDREPRPLYPSCGLHALEAIEQKKLIYRLTRIKFGKKTSDLITVLVEHDKPEALTAKRKTQPKPPPAPQTFAPSSHHLDEIMPMQ
jgi:hypothetical protein